MGTRASNSSLAARPPSPTSNFLREAGRKLGYSEQTDNAKAVFFSYRKNDVFYGYTK